MVDRSGEVHDVRTRNRGLKILLLALIALVLLVGIAAAVYFFVFWEDGKAHLEFEPTPVKDSLIYVNRNDEEIGQGLSEKIDNFLKAYRQPPSGDKTICNQDYLKPESQRDIPCAIDVSTLTECSDKNDRYGYTGKHQPCVIVKLNKIVGWEPEPYFVSDEEEALNHGMPGNLFQYIKTLNESKVDVNRRMVNTTWITCEGASPADKENIGQLGYYYPGFYNKTNIFGGIPNTNFPYLEQEAYLSPFIFVKFFGPVNNVVIRVKCQAWAKNIDATAGEGSVEFELMID